MDAVGIILARGGSKGIPRKNIAMLGSKPLIAWTIDAAQRSRLDRVIVSTDDEEIADVARAYGAEVPFVRPLSLAGDDAPPDAAEYHALARLADVGYEPDALVRLQPTSPFREWSDIDNALDDLEDGWGAVVGVAESETHPYVMVEFGRDGNLIPHPCLQQPRQSYPQSYRINGAIYAAWVDYHRVYGFYGPGCKPYLMPNDRSMDIDTPWDLQLAEAVA